MKTIIPADGPSIKIQGTAMMKSPNPVYMLQQDDPFLVQTIEGFLSAHAGDYVAYDPISGNVWPVAASYVEQHYKPHTVQPVNSTALAARLTRLLLDFTYESIEGRGKRGLMPHHIEALLKDLVPFIEQEIVKASNDALNAVTQELAQKEASERKALSTHWYGEERAA